MAKNKDLAFSEGETWVINFALRDAAGQPLDLTGGLVEWAVESVLPGGASLLVATTGAFVSISSATAGLGTVSIPPADHASVPAAEYRHELRATLADATVTVQIVGNLTVGASVHGPDAESFGIFRTGNLQLTFDSGTSDADPGDGEFRFNNAAPASAAFVYADLLDRFGVDITDWLEALDDSTTTAGRGRLRFAKASNEAVWHEFLVTGAVVTATGYRKIPVSYVDGGGSFAAGDIATVQFSPTGNTGQGGLPYTYSSTTTDSDPGAGVIRANNASLSAATQFYIDDLDSAGNNLEAFLLAWDDSTNTVKGYVTVSRLSDNAKAVFSVSAITDASGYVKVTVAYVSGATSLTNGDAVSIEFSRTGDKGAAGTDGTDPGILFTFDTGTTDADPGAGKLRANNASLASATSLYIDDLDSAGNNLEAFLLAWDDSTNTVKGHLYLTRASDGVQTIFTVGTVTDASGYVKVAVTYVSGATSFSNADVISAQFYRAGNVGDAGSAGVSGASALTVVRVASTANVVIATALENGDTLNGVTLATNDLVLLTAQTAPAENGVYVVPASGAASRHASFDAYDELCGSYFSVMEGTVHADTLWRCTSNKGGTIDVTAVAISRFTGSQVVNTQTGAVATGTTTMPLDDTIPQNTEGDQYMTLAITPTNASSTLRIDVSCMATHSAATHWIIAALFQDSTASALASTVGRWTETTGGGQLAFVHYMTAGTTIATTFKVRIGSNTAGTTTFNGIGGARYFGGVMASSITITEMP